MEQEHIFPWEIEEPEGSRNSWSEYGRLLADAVLNNKELPTKDGYKNPGHNIRDTFKSGKSKAARLVFLNGFNESIRLETADKLSEALRLSKNESLLLHYYASCSSGFRPANKTIEAATGLKPKHVSETINALENKGILVQLYLYEGWEYRKTSPYKNPGHNIEYIIEIDWKDLYRNACRLVDNKPKVVWENGKSKRIPVVKEIEHIPLTEVDKLLICYNSQSPCFRCDNDCEDCPYWEQEWGNKIEKTEDDYRSSCRDENGEKIRYTDNPYKNPGHNIYTDYTIPLTDTISLSQEELDEARASVLKTVQDNEARHQVSQNLIRLQLIDWDLQEYQEYPLPF